MKQPWRVWRGAAPGSPCNPSPPSLVRGPTTPSTLILETLSHLMRDSYSELNKFLLKLTRDGELGHEEATILSKREKPTSFLIGSSGQRPGATGPGLLFSWTQEPDKPPDEAPAGNRGTIPQAVRDAAQRSGLTGALRSGAQLLSGSSVPTAPAWVLGGTRYPAVPSASKATPDKGKTPKASPRRPVTASPTSQGTDPGSGSRRGKKKGKGQPSPRDAEKDGTGAEPADASVPGPPAGPPSTPVRCPHGDSGDHHGDGRTHFGPGAGGGGWPRQPQRPSKSLGPHPGPLHLGLLLLLRPLPPSCRQQPQGGHLGESEARGLEPVGGGGTRHHPGGVFHSPGPSPRDRPGVRYMEADARGFEAQRSAAVMRSRYHPPCVAPCGVTPAT
eukprot:jgi/Botrbrau1/8226/Bobra.0392s0022.1